MQLVVLAAGNSHQIYPEETWRAFEREFLAWQASFLHKHRDSCLWVLDGLAKPVNPLQKFIRNVRSDLSGSGESLLLAIEELQATELTVLYGDVVFSEKLLNILSESPRQNLVVFGYTNSADQSLFPRERITLVDGRVVASGNHLLDTELPEFSGIAKIGPDALRLLRAKGNEFERPYKGSVSSLISSICGETEFSGLDGTGLWAEVRDSRDVARFFLDGKAQSLNKIAPSLQHSRVPSFFILKRTDWESNSLSCLGEIASKFADSKIAVRSSSASEDGFHMSNAGAFLSLLNVDSTSSDELTSAINDVFASYPEIWPDDELILQLMVTKPIISGVVFTRGLSTGAPIYTISYDPHSGKTDSITSGSQQEFKTRLLWKIDSGSSQEVWLQSLITAVHELENLVEFDALDVEFAVTEDNRVWILQIRPLAGVVAANNKLDSRIKEELAFATQDFEKVARRKLLGSSACFGVMPDWNPAEIIGLKPRHLAYSIYHDVITNRVWSEARKLDGYRDVGDLALMHKFAGTPYIDVRASFNSFLPSETTEGVGQKIVDYALQTLESQPELHDKVEFSVMPTVWSFDQKRWTEFLAASGLNQMESELFTESHKQILDRAIHNTSNLLAEVDEFDQSSIRTFTADQQLSSALELLEITKSGPTLNFARLARRAFIATSLLRSSVAAKILEQSDVDYFLSTIPTVASQFANELALLAAGEVELKTVIEHFGHLRPGTYEITSSCYSSSPEKYLSPLTATFRIENNSQAIQPKSERLALVDRLANELRGNGLNVTTQKLDEFLTEAISGREFSKLVFTKFLSQALENFAHWGQEHGLSRDDLSHADLDDLRRLAEDQGTSPEAIGAFRQQIAISRDRWGLQSKIEVPDLVFTAQDFLSFEIPSSRPNFVGGKSVRAETCQVSDSTNLKDLNGRIAIIDAADPGYDWLFGAGIVGLVTKYGGGNSHMAVRCSELGLPAAIGVGTSKFKAILGKKFLSIDPTKQFLEGY